MKNVLLIDDDELLGKIIRDALSEAGYMVTRAVDASQGQQAILRVNPDVIILDLMLPAGNGVELLRNLRLSTKTQHFPVIVITSFNDADVEKEIDDIGIQAFFHKPFEPADLVEKVKQITS